MSVEMLPPDGLSKTGVAEVAAAQAQHELVLDIKNYLKHRNYRRWDFAAEIGLSDYVLRKVMKG